MDQVGLPAELLGGVDCAARIKDNALVVVGAVAAEDVAVAVELLEIVIVVDEIDLDARRMHRSDLHHQRMVALADHYAHAAQTDHFVKLVAPLVDVAVIGHERAHFIFARLHGLRKVAADFAIVCCCEIGGDFLRYEYYPVCCHLICFYRLTTDSMRKVNNFFRLFRRFYPARAEQGVFFTHFHYILAASGRFEANKL